jgi:hypothetical protein
MRTTRTDTLPIRGARVCRLAETLLAGLAALFLSACSKQPEPQAGDGGAKDQDAQAEAQRRQQSARNLKQIGMALHMCNDTYKQLPPAALCDKKTGKPLLSWRVAILQFLDQDELFKQFNRDEPWDGPTNKKLLEKMPSVYAPVGVTTKEPHSTFYRVFVAPPGSKLTTAFMTSPSKHPVWGANGTAIPRSFPDGTSLTIGVVEAGEAVPWTKPDELPYDPKAPLPKLGGLFKDGFHALMMDGNVLFLTRQIDEKTLRDLITANDGTPIDLEELKAKGMRK